MKKFFASRFARIYITLPVLTVVLFMSAALTHKTNAAVNRIIDKLPVRGYIFTFDQTGNNITVDGNNVPGINTSTEFKWNPSSNSYDANRSSESYKMFSSFKGDDSCPAGGGIVIYSFNLGNNVSESNALSVLDKSTVEIDNAFNKQIIIPKKADGRYTVIKCIASVNNPVKFVAIGQFGSSPGGGGAGGGGAPVIPGNLEWFDTAGTRLNKADFAGRFIFISPQEIRDTVKNITYSTGQDSSVFGNNVNDRLLNDGNYIYLPRKEGGTDILEKGPAGTCSGGFRVVADNSGNYGKIYSAPAITVNSACFLGSNPVLDPAVQGKITVPLSPLLADSNLEITNTMSWSQRKLFYSYFRWESATSIFSYSAQGLLKLANETKGVVLPDIGVADKPGLEIWTGDSCDTQGSIFPFILVDHNSTDKTTTDTSINSPNIQATFYIQKDGGVRGWRAAYNGDKLKCMLGHEIKGNEKYSPNPSEAGGQFSYIAYPSLAVGNTTGHFGDPGVIIPPAGAGTGDVGKNAPECSYKLFNPLTWLICPLYDAAVATVDQFDKAIINQLTVNINTYFDENQATNPKSYNTAKSVHIAWSSVRDIAMGILVIVGLIMVISQAFEFGPFDAYTIKKVLPRLLIAVIAIALSWQILQLAIDISNGLGVGVRAIIENPFKSLHATKIKGGTSSVFVLIGGGALFGLGLLGILSFALTALLGVVIGFATIIFRQMLILLLVITAPFAIACSILPNTQKAWKLWYDGLMGALLAFPIIMGFISIGRVFSQIAGQTDTDFKTDLLAQVIAIIAYFAPYFLLPTAFKLAGGIFSTVAGMANDKSRGPFDMLKKYRKRKTAENVTALKAGDRYHKNNILARAVNRGGIGAAAGLRGNFGVGRKGAAARARIQQVAAVEAAKNNPALQQLALNDDHGNAVLALSGGTAAGAEQASQDLAAGWRNSGTSAADAEIRRLDAVASAKAVGVSRVNAQAALSTMMQNKARSVAAGDEGREILARGMNRLTPNNTVARGQVAGGVQYGARTGGRTDLGDDELAGGWRRTSMQQLAADTTPALQAHLNEIRTRYQSSDSEVRAGAAVHLLEAQNLLPGTSEENALAISTLMDELGIDRRDGAPGIDRQLADGANMHLRDIRTRARIYGSDTPVETRDPRTP